MSEQSEPPDATQRTELPIERGFPIERVNEIAEKEGRAKMYYRPIYTMHKWWARRLGCVFRAICLYTLLDDPEKVEVYEPGHENETLAGWGNGDETLDIAGLMDRVNMSDPEIDAVGPWFGGFRVTVTLPGTDDQEDPER